MALPITVPNTFATETNNIPLSDLDDNFTVVETAINGIGNGSEALANVAVTGGTINVTTITSTTANLTTINVTTLNATGGGISPTGSLTMWAGAVASPPTGWLACNGANVSRTTYAALFAVVGTAWGAGDGSTTFGLPNLLNKFPVGAGDTYALAATGGSADTITVAHTHTGTTASNGAHTHNLNNNSGQAQSGQLFGTSNYLARSAGGSAEYGIAAANTNQQNTVSIASNGAHTHTFTTDSTGSSGTNANLPPYVAVGYIIKT